MTLHRGNRVETLTKSVGRASRHGVVEAVHDGTVEVRWDDGHRSVLSGGVLVPERKKPGR